ncbi:MAG TPA: PadR family transcriptional regulator [Verrucomicrobiae bacterium]|nr:PadR family transcriptional regulator [Verrucomicrobiae bacterium]
MHRHHDCEHFGFRGHHGPFGHRGRFFRRFGGPFMGGPGMRFARMLASGDLQLIILAQLSEKPRHGYEIIKQIEEHSSGAYAPSPGMVYPALTYLEEMGYAESEAEGAKKLYRITEAGTKHLNENRAAAEETLEQLARFGRKISEFQKRFAEENEETDSPGSARGIKPEWRAAKKEFRDVRDDLKSALYEKFDAPPDERRRVLDILRKAIAEIRGK